MAKNKTDNKAAPRTIEMWAVDRPIPYEKNPRVLGKVAIEKLAKSIKSFGFNSPIIVDGEGVIINGHTRLRAAVSLGMKEVPVIVVKDLSPEKVKAYRIADNRVAQETEWDDKLLAEELADLSSTLGADDALLHAELCSMTGFDDKELTKLLDPGSSEEEEVDPDEDKPNRKVSVTVETECPKCGHTWTDRPKKDKPRKKFKTIVCEAGDDD